MLSDNNKILNTNALQVCLLGEKKLNIFKNLLTLIQIRKIYLG